MQRHNSLIFQELGCHTRLTGQANRKMHFEDIYTMVSLVLWRLISSDRSILIQLVSVFRKTLRIFNAMAFKGSDNSDQFQ